MNNRHHWQLKNQHSGGCFNSSANLANSPQKWAKWAELAVLFSWQLITAPTILIFSIAMGADYSFEPSSIVH